MGQVRDIWLCLEMMPDGVYQYWNTGVLECWSVGKNRQVPVFTDQIILRSKSILLQVFAHYSITPALHYSNTPFWAVKNHPLSGVNRSRVLWARIFTESISPLPHQAEKERKKYRQGNEGLCMETHRMFALRV